MKNRTRLLTPLLAVALLAAGCGHVHPDGTPVTPTEDAMIVSNDAVTFAVNEVDAAVVSGLLKPEQVRPYLPIRDAARAAVKEGKAALDRGDVDAAKVSLQAANAAYAKLVPLLRWLDANQKKGK